MSGRAGGDSAAGGPDRKVVGLAPGHRPASTQGLARIAVLSTLLLLAVYTAIAITRVQREPQAASLANAGLTARAEALAARVDAEAAALRAGAIAAREALARRPDAAMDAAETGLRAAGGAASAFAVLSDEEMIALSGAVDAADWSSLTRQAARGGQEIWFGVGGAAQPVLAVAAPAATSKGRRWVAAVGDRARMARLLDAQKDEALVSSAGQTLAAVGPGGVAQAPSVNAAFALAPDDLRFDRLVRAERPDGAGLDLAARPAAGGALVAISAAPAGPSEAAATTERLVWLLIPLGVAILLGLLLVSQSRRVEHAQRAQADSEHRFRLAVEAARCGIWEWDLAQDRMFMSDVTGAMFGWGGGGVVPGAQVLGRVAADHRARVQEALASAATHGAFDVSFRIPHPEGGRSTWIDARGQAFGRRSGSGYTQIIGVALDVTEERYAQARAQAAENRLRDAIESVSEAFVLWDRRGLLRMCNQNYRQMFGLEAVAMKPGIPRDRVEEIARLAIQRELPASAGKGLREAELADGRWIQISERRTTDGGQVMTAVDITAIKAQEESRRLNEEQLQRAIVDLERSQEQLSELARKYEAEKIRAEAANRAKSEFLANMSHELRTPLNAVNGFSEIMVGEMYGPLGDPRYKGYAQDILSSGQHLLALINDILDMSKIEAGKMTLKFEPLSLEEVADDAIRLVRNRADSAGLALEVDLAHLPDVEADYRALKQVLLNLLSNAIKFTPRNGRIRIHASTSQDPFGERVKVSVSDTGIGIAADDLARLAQPFEQIENQHAKTQQGTGLGLALTKSLVEMHGGALNISSAPGEGTSVSFTLPIRQGRTAIAGPGVAA